MCVCVCVCHPPPEYSAANILNSTEKFDDYLRPILPNLHIQWIFSYHFL